MSVRVYDLAHARAGDKGNTSNISVIAYTDEGWRILQRELTPERVLAHFRHITPGPIRRYELPQLRALNFVLENALGGGVTRSLAIDPHGKSLSALMLTLELPGADPEKPRYRAFPGASSGHKACRQRNAMAAVASSPKTQ